MFQNPYFEKEVKKLLHNGAIKTRNLRSDDENDNTCNPEEVNLADYPQWKNEIGYFIGEYSLYGSDGNAYVSDSWDYRYDHYKGFITGNVNG